MQQKSTYRDRKRGLPGEKAEDGTERGSVGEPDSMVDHLICPSASVARGLVDKVAVQSDYRDTR
jgi:hypothetical protein